MISRLKKIPSPNSLIIFEASARHLSFTRAAFELSLTQAAISKQIANLEQRLGHQLFIRLHRSLRLSQQGTLLYKAVASGLGQIADAVEELNAPPSSKSVTVAATTAFAQMWLLPKLGLFMQQHPDIDLRMLTSENHLSAVDEGADIAIKYGDNSWTKAESTFLLSGEIFPVCSPELAQRHQLNNLPQLAQVPLIDLDDSLWRWVKWKDWLIDQHSPLRDLRISIEFNNIPMLYSAAEAGQGIALGWSEFVQDLLDAGRLVAPFKQKVQIPKPWGYYILAPSKPDRAEEITKVKQWILQQAQDNPLLGRRPESPLTTYAPQQE